MAIKNHNNSIAGLLVLAGAEILNHNTDFFKQHYSNLTLAHDEVDLKSLDLYYTYFISICFNHNYRGHIPNKCTFKLKQLRCLCLSENNLYKELDNSSTWNLVTLDLSKNIFTKFPIDFGQFPFLVNFITLMC